jgi:UDP-N-acetylmuramyl pentapeptide phosphotransferase/UDP-N-acetylglucosamine-1-phosphate transferase
MVPLAVLFGTAWLTGVVLGWLRRRDILDHPVERSSHQIPIPRGGGLALIPLALFAWLMLAAAGEAPHETNAVVAIAAMLAIVSWRDDLSGLGVVWRLAAHLVAATLGVLALPDATPVFQGLLPPLLDRAAAVLLWVWFVNLYNFMDGIDGVTCTETIFLGLGAALVLLLAGAGDDHAPMLALIAASAAAGFLRWNWPPAKIFLGDVGSVPLGFMTGWLLLAMAAKGLWVPALILPLYYLADATLTLLMRTGRGERIWQAHRQHFYQRALAPDGDHGAVLLLIIGGNTALLALAAVAVLWPWPALVLAMLATATLLAQLARRARSRPASQ